MKAKVDTGLKSTLARNEHTHSTKSLNTQEDLISPSKTDESPMPQTMDISDLMSPDKFAGIEYVQIPDQHGQMHIISRAHLIDHLKQFAQLNP